MGRKTKARQTGGWLGQIKFLNLMNTQLVPAFLAAIASVSLCFVGVGLRVDAQELRSELRDQGPVYVGTVLNRSWAGNPTMKAIVVKLGTNDSDYVAYDEDLLRVSLLWTGGFLNFPNRGRERIEHPQAAEVAGVGRFGTRPEPGWALADQTTDPRPNQRGPLPKSWAHHTGIYLHGDRVVLSYQVAGTPVLELPGLEASGESKAFTRTLQIGPSAAPLDLLVASSDTNAAIVPLASVSPLSESVPIAASGPTRVAATSANAGVLRSTGQELTAVQMSQGPQGSEWLVQAGNRLVLRLPALPEKTLLKLVHWTGSAGNWSGFQALAATPVPATDPASFTKGGPSRWAQTVHVKGVRGTNPGAYQLDTLPEPLPNPWKTKTYLSGFDFFPDGRAAVGTFHGDVWIVSGLDSALENVIWKRYATGLFQPLGLKIVRGEIYVTCRDALVRLHDFNKDGEADYYANFNNDTVVTPNYHEFCLDLDTDSAGNFYYAKGAPWPPNVTSPHQGTVLRVSPDGNTLDVVATGLRAPNGLAVGPQDEVTFSDNEGHYIPSSKVSLVKPGNRFYGMAQTAHGPAPTDFEPPIFWLPKSMDNSSGGQVWVTSDRWGPLKGSMLFMSYGKATLFSVLQETVNGRVQGGAVPFPFRFPTGVMRARFSPTDGQLYLTGLRGWQTAGVRDGGFFRVRYTGEEQAWPVAFRATKQGLELSFSSPVTTESAQDLANWGVEQWNYIYSSGYGSPEVSTTDPRVKTHEVVEVSGVTVSDGGKKVFLKMPAIKPVMQMRVRLKLEAPDKAPVIRDIYLTLHGLG